MLRKTQQKAKLYRDSKYQDCPEKEALLACFGLTLFAQSAEYVLQPMPRKFGLSQ